MAKGVPLSVIKQDPGTPGNPGTASPESTPTNENPTSPTGGEKHIELAQKHDFAGKFRHPELLERVKNYVLSQVEVRRAISEGHELPPEPTVPDAAPISINLDLTTGCNYACDHCVDMDILNQPIKFKHDNLTDSITNMVERGLKSVIVIGGGEPTLYRQFEQAIRHMKELGLRVAIVSNGSGQAKIKQIADCLDEEDWVRLSLDSGRDATFKAMHKPKKPISLEEICEAVPGIKEVNGRFQYGFSYIITWKGAFINDTNIVPNIDEIIEAAELAQKNEFDYISYKPFLTRAPENNAEIVDLRETDDHFDRVLDRIREMILEARKFETDKFRVVESTNLRVLENRSHQQFMEQPRQCHMQFFRQVLSPLGLYNCPVYRNQEHGRINDKEGYTTLDSYQKSLSNTATLIRGFNATHECREVTCLYNHVNWWIEDLIENPEKLDKIEPDHDREPDYFF